MRVGRVEHSTAALDTSTLTEVVDVLVECLDGSLAMDVAGLLIKASLCRAQRAAVSEADNGTAWSAASANVMSNDRAIGTQNSMVELAAVYL